VSVVPGTGIRKFTDSLPGMGAANANDLGQYIPVATPDTTTYPGSDYYEIELGEYTEQLHSDLPPTTLRGYRQTNTTDPTVKKFTYTGPMIVSQRDRPVRIKFTNNLPTGEGGNLFLPVDTTVMGAGMGPDGMSMYTENRATLHLHGGFTPWISDGTPHQWTTPAGESTPYPKGVSVKYVPDMWFDAGGNPVPAGMPGATNDPGDGSLTFYYTNQQSARLDVLSRPCLRDNQAQRVCGRGLALHNTGPGGTESGQQRSHSRRPDPFDHPGQDVRA
jgi:hypothetical protein